MPAAAKQIEREQLDAWHNLYAAALAQAQVFTREEIDHTTFLDEDVLEASQELLVDSVLEIAADRGAVTFRRWAEAAIRALEARIATKGRRRLSPAWRARYTQHVRTLRALVEAKQRRSAGAQAPAPDQHLISARGKEAAAALSQKP